MNNYLETNSATLTTGDDVISVTGNVDMSILTDDYLCAIRTGQYLVPVISGTAPNANGVSTITLAKPWNGANINNSEIFVFPTFANVASTITSMDALNEVSRAILKRFNDLLMSSASSIDIRVGATAKITTTPYQYLVNQVSSLINQLNTLMDNIDTTLNEKVDAQIVENIKNIRYGKVDNPLVHLFKKNKLVETLSGELSWTRDSGATTFDMYDEFNYSPSPYATNFALQSENFAHNVWGKTYIALNAGMTNYNGLNTATEIVEGTQSGEHFISETTSTITAGAVKSSVIVKLGQGSRRDCRLRCADSTGFVGAGYFNLTRASAKSSGGVFNEHIIPMGNGFYRCSISWVTNGLAAVIGVYLVEEDETSTSYVGDGVSSIILGGVQFEKSNVANGYVKTLDTIRSGSSYVGIDVTRQEKNGWLVEGASTNYLRHTCNFSHNAWVVYNGVIKNTVTEITNPDGSKQTTGFLVDDTLGIIRQGMSNSGNDDKTFSVWFYIRDMGGVKKLTVDYGDGQAAENDVDLTNVPLHTWVRIVFTGLVKGLIDHLDIKPSVKDAGVFDFSLWGANLSPSSFADSDIITKDVPLTRSRDIVSFNPHGNMPNLTDEYTISFVVTRPKGSQFSRVFGVDKYSYFYARLYPDGDISLSSIDGNSVTSSATTIDIVRPVFYAITQSKTHVTVYVIQDGVVASTTKERGPIVTPYLSPTKFVIGNSAHATSSTEAFYGTFNDFKIFDVPMSLIELTLMSGE